jgi:hypothetical protein
LGLVQSIRCVVWEEQVDEDHHLQSPHSREQAVDQGFVVDPGSVEVESQFWLLWIVRLE